VIDVNFGLNNQVAAAIFFLHLFGFDYLKCTQKTIKLMKRRGTLAKIYELQLMKVAMMKKCLGMHSKAAIVAQVL
jgi:hypothetical protein